MKQALFVLALSMTSLVALAQKNKKENKTEPLPPPRVWISGIPTYNTTHDLMVANTTFITDSVGCRVSGFTISLTAPGQPFYGPLHAVGWEMTETQKNTIKKWDYPNVTVHIQDIHLNCHETDATSPALEYYYNEK
jgi:hypothetical protein